ncbi:MAG: hypothetical protein FJ308_10550 [Planctomycetes bacterium]|nr:hypothetical protein [Planctomycetota bacterium]
MKRLGRIHARYPSSKPLSLMVSATCWQSPHRFHEFCPTSLTWKARNYSFQRFFRVDHDYYPPVGQDTLKSRGGSTSSRNFEEPCGTLRSGVALRNPKSTVESLDHWSKWFLVALLCAFPFLVYLASGIKIGSASAHAWLPEGREERTRYEQFLESFGSDQFLVASWDGCRLDDPRLVQFKSELLALDETRGKTIDFIQTSKEVVESLTNPPLSIPEKTALNRLEGSIIGRDGTAAVFVRFTPEGIAHQKESVGLVREAADRVPRLTQNDLRMVGSVYEAFAVDEAAENSLRKLVLPSSLFGVILAWLCLRSVRAAIAVLVIAGVGQLLAIAIVTVTGGVFSAVLIVLPTLVFMLTLSAAVHFMNYYRDVAYDHRDRLGARAILLGFKPSVLATLTTALGMAALATSQLSPVRTFGLYSASTLCLATVILILCFPKLADWLCLKSFQQNRSTGSNSSAEQSDGPSQLASNRPGYGEDPDHSLPVSLWAVRYSEFVQRNYVAICVLGFSLLLFSFYGLLHLQSSTKFDDMFPKSSPTVRSMAWIEEHLGPIASVEIMMRFPGGNAADPYEQLEWVDRVTNQLRSNSDIGGVISATTFLPKIPSSSRVRDVAKRSVFRSEIPKRLDMLEDKGLLARTEDENIWRLTAKVSALSRLNYGQLTEKVSQSVAEVQRTAIQGRALGINGMDNGLSNNVANDNRLGPEDLLRPFRAEYTGLSPIMHDTQLALLDDLGSSFSTAFLLITPVMMLIARGFRSGLLIMIPNVLPETLVFGSMAWLGYSIDIAGILTASVAMGIAVNDTLHFVNWYTRRLSLGDTRQQAIADTFSNCAKAMVHTMLISCCSMVPFMFAEFNPTRQFAILMIAMMSSSILGDLVLLPALLLSPLGKTKPQSPSADIASTNTDSTVGSVSSQGISSATIAAVES